MEAFPRQPPDVPWPTDTWPRRADDPEVDTERLAALVGAATADPQPPELAETRAVVVCHRGALVAEAYGTGTDDATPLRSWSMAKSVLSMLVGILVDEGRLTLDDPAAVAEWSADGDPRAAITLQHLLTMRAGLAWQEEYAPGAPSDVQEMLFGSGADDTAAFAASQPLVAEPGATLCYSSGVSNIVSRVVGDVVGRRDAFEAWARGALLEPIGAREASFGFDDAGTWVGSSSLWLTARDWARVGLLALRGGEWDGRQVVPEQWMAWSTAPSGTDADGDRHAAHWWVLPDPPGGFWASGYHHQHLWMVPRRDLVVVRLGKTPPSQRAQVRGWLRQVVDCVEETAAR